jgi:arylsulfatase A-like enzyme
MKSYLITCVIVACSIPLDLRAQPAPTTRPPNIVVILVDDMGHRDLGCTGSTYFRTPHIDRLAKDGVRFTSAYAAAPVCSPTRAALLTGIHPARLRLTDWLPGRRDMPSQKLLRPQFRQNLSRDTVTLPEALKEFGYTSAHVGKWHLGGDGSLPTDHGFDVNIGGTHAGSPPGGYFDFKTPTLATDGEYLTDRLTTESLGFIEKNKSKPFFLHLSHYTVHIPLQAKEELITRYRDESKKDDPQYNPVYAAMIHSLDESVGRIVQKLTDLDLLDNTLIIFTSDNGGLSTKEGPHTPATNNTPLRAGKGYLYEGGIRVPLIMHWPARVQAETSDVPVTTQDIHRTIVREAGTRHVQILGIPETYTPGQAINLIPTKGLINGRLLFWHYPHYSNQGGRPSSAIRQGDWKLIEFFEDDRVELYNLKDDASESTNLVDKQPEKAKELRHSLHAWRNTVEAQLPTPNPGYSTQP